MTGATSPRPIAARAQGSRVWQQVRLEFQLRQVREVVIDAENDAFSDGRLEPFAQLAEEFRRCDQNEVLEARVHQSIPNFVSQFARKDGHLVFLPGASFEGMPLPRARTDDAPGPVGIGSTLTKIDVCSPSTSAGLAASARIAAEGCGSLLGAAC